MWHDVEQVALRPLDMSTEDVSPFIQEAPSLLKMVGESQVFQKKNTCRAPCSQRHEPGVKLLLHMNLEHNVANRRRCFNFHFGHNGFTSAVCCSGELLISASDIPLPPNELSLRLARWCFLELLTVCLEHLSRRSAQASSDSEDPNRVHDMRTLRLGAGMGRCDADSWALTTPCGNIRHP